MPVLAKRSKSQIRVSVSRGGAIWTVYILECADGTLYTGIAKDLARRVDEHNDGLGAKYTRARRPVSVIYTEVQPDRSQASRREYAIKALSRSEKLALAVKISQP